MKDFLKYTLAHRRILCMAKLVLYTLAGYSAVESCDRATLGAMGSVSRGIEK